MLMELKSVEEVGNIKSKSLVNNKYGLIEDSRIYLLTLNDDGSYIWKDLNFILEGTEINRGLRHNSIETALEFVIKRRETRDCILYSSNDIDSLLYKLLSLKKRGL
jgi:hypothetical protein